MTRQYRTRTKHQNGASITSGSTSLTAGTLLQGQGLSGATFPYTVAVYAQDTSGNLTSYEVMNVTGGTYPTLTVTRGIDGTTAVAHDTTHIIAQVVGTTDLNNFLQAGAAGLSQFSWLLKTTNYSVTTADSGILADATGGNVTITLPTAVGATQFYAIGRKDASANTITIATTSAQTIDGFASIPLVVQDQAVLLASDGANWFILSSYYPSPLTTKGDLLVAGASGIANRLGVSGGSNGYALVQDSTQTLGVKWAAIAGSSTLAGDTDVTISSPADGDVLRFSTSDSKWHNHKAESAGYHQAAGTLQSIPTSSTTIVNYDTSDWDTDTLVTTGASWHFTAPIAGKYRVFARLSLVSTAFASGHILQLQIDKNGSFYSLLGRSNSMAAFTDEWDISGSDLVSCAASDTIDIRVFQNTGNPVTLNGDVTRNRVAIELAIP